MIITKIEQAKAQYKLKYGEDPKYLLLSGQSLKELEALKSDLRYTLHQGTVSAGYLQYQGMTVVVYQSLFEEERVEVI